MGRIALCTLALSLVAGCGETEGVDGGAADAAARDAAPRDAGVDAGTTAPDASIDGAAADAGAGDGGTPDASTDPCADAPVVDRPIGLDAVYGNSAPRSERFDGVTPWEDVLSMPFPRTHGIATRLRARRGEMTVIAFDTTDVAAESGSLQTENPQITGNTGTKRVAISRCPGDFEPADPRCVRFMGVTGNLPWSFEDEPFTCPLERDRRYYLNVLFTDDRDLPADWACSLAPDAEDCAFLFASRSG